MRGKASKALIGAGSLSTVALQGRRGHTKFVESFTITRNIPGFSSSDVSPSEVLSGTGSGHVPEWRGRQWSADVRATPYRFHTCATPLPSLTSVALGPASTVSNRSACRRMLSSVRERDSARKISQSARAPISARGGSAERDDPVDPGDRRILNSTHDVSELARGVHAVHDRTLSTDHDEGTAVPPSVAWCHRGVMTT
jgi:hypothetical protein